LARPTISYRYTGIYDYKLRNFYKTASLYNAVGSVISIGKNFRDPYRKIVEPIYYSVSQGLEIKREQFYLPTSNEDYDGLMEMLKDYIAVKDLCFIIACFVFGKKKNPLSKFQKEGKKKNMDYLICEQTNPLEWKCQNNFESFEAASGYHLTYMKYVKNQTTLIQVPKYLPIPVKEKLVAYQLQPNVLIRK